MLIIERVPPCIYPCDQCYTAQQNNQVANGGTIIEVQGLTNQIIPFKSINRPVLFLNNLHKNNNKMFNVYPNTIFLL